MKQPRKRFNKISFAKILQLTLGFRRVDKPLRLPVTDSGAIQQSTALIEHADGERESDLIDGGQARHSAENLLIQRHDASITAAKFETALSCARRATV